MVSMACFFYYFPERGGVGDRGWGGGRIGEDCWGDGCREITTMKRRIDAVSVVARIRYLAEPNESLQINTQRMSMFTYLF